MNDSEYHNISDELLITIEEAIENCGTDIDFESVSGLLTLTFINQSKIIINKQAPLHELWVATKVNGHHFAMQDDLWIDKRSGAEFWQFMSQAVSKQANADIHLSDQ